MKKLWQKNSHEFLKKLYTYKKQGPLFTWTWISFVRKYIILFDEKNKCIQNNFWVWLSKANSSDSSSVNNSAQSSVHTVGLGSIVFIACSLFSQLQKARGEKGEPSIIKINILKLIEIQSPNNSLCMQMK